MCNRIYLALLLMFFHSLTYAQEAKVRGSFLADSVKIGEEISYTLTASYSKNLTLIFPDSTFSFTPFEFQKKKFWMAFLKELSKRVQYYSSFTND